MNVILRETGNGKRHLAVSRKRNAQSLALAFLIYHNALPRVCSNYGKYKYISNQWASALVCFVRTENMWVVSRRAKGAWRKRKTFPLTAAPPARNKLERRLPAYRRKEQSGNNKMLLTVFSLSMLLHWHWQLEAGTSKNVDSLLFFTGAGYVSETISFQTCFIFWKERFVCRNA